MARALAMSGVVAWGATAGLTGVVAPRAAHAQEALGALLPGEAPGGSGPSVPWGVDRSMSDARSGAATWHGLGPGRELSGIWAQGGNPAGLGGVRDPGGERFSLAFGRVAGAHRHPQAPAVVRGVVAAVEGASRARDPAHWAVQGAIRYRAEERDDVRWSAVADPLRSGPYVWADSGAGDWERSSVEVTGAAGSPALAGGLRVGIAVEGAWGQGARSTDPRPLFRTREIWIVPGVTLPRHAGVSLGLHLRLGGTLEESEIGAFASRDPFVYRLRGFGTFDRTQLVTAARTQTGRHLGAGVQVASASGDRDWGLSLELGVRSDTIRQGIAAPQPGGSTRARLVRSSAAMRREIATDREGSVEAVIEAEWKEGTDPIFAAVNVEEVAWAAGVRWREGRFPLPGGMHPAVGVGAEGRRWEDRAAATHLESVAVWSSVGAAHPLARRTALRAEVAVRLPVRTVRTIERSTALTPVLVDPGYRWATAGHVRATVGVRRYLAHLRHGALHADVRVEHLLGRGQPAVDAPTYAPDPGAGRNRVLVALQMVRP